MIGREKGYHGVNFGGISVGGIAGNRKFYGQGIEADHLPHTQPPLGTFAKGMPDTDGRALADRLLDVIHLHDASTIAAVIVNRSQARPAWSFHPQVTCSACVRSARSTASC